MTQDSAGSSGPTAEGPDSTVDRRTLPGEGGPAIVATDPRLAMPVGAFVIDYQGRRLRCFGNPDAAQARLVGA